MKKTKFEILIFICMILLGLGCFLIATKNNQYNFFEDILSRYPEENIAGTLMVVHIAKLNGRLCGAKRPHSVSEQPNFYQSLQSNPYNDSSHPSGGE